MDGMQTRHCVKLKYFLNFPTIFLTVFSRFLTAKIFFSWFFYHFLGGKIRPLAATFFLRILFLRKSLDHDALALGPKQHGARASILKKKLLVTSVFYTLDENSEFSSWKAEVASRKTEITSSLV